MNPTDPNNQTATPQVFVTLQDSNFPSGIIKPRHLAADTTQAAGDIYYVDTNGIFKRLPAGSNGALLNISSKVPAYIPPGSTNQVLTVSGGVPAWQTPSSSISIDGWIADSNTWTYASASTFTITGDKTAIFTKGTRLKFTQTTVKYGVVASSSVSAGTTTVTIIVNSDYVLSNATISLNYYSYVANPQEWPGWFAYSPTWTGFSTYPTATTKFTVFSNTIIVYCNPSVNGTSNATTFTVTLPVSSADAVNLYAPAQIVNNSTTQSTPGLVKIEGATSTLKVLRQYDEGGSFTTSGGKGANFTLTYNF